MSNPTTPFSWQMPTATDLVTDLPADFEVFGQAVATSMGDLLGGSSGYILSKASGTDMDFTWIANDQGDITGVTAGNGISVTDPTGPVPTVAIDTAVTVDKTTAQTLTNKTLTTPIISSISNTGTLTLPSSTDTLVGRATTDTLTNKTLTSPALTTPTISTATTNGDLLYGTGSGALQRLGIGSAAQVLSVSSGIPAWSTPSSGAMVLVKARTSFSVVTDTGTTFDSVFTSTYKNYVVIIDRINGSVGGGGSTLNFTYRYGSTSHTNTYYGLTHQINLSGTTTNILGNGVQLAGLGALYSSDQSLFNITVSGANDAALTMPICVNGFTSALNGMLTGGWQASAAQNYNGFQLSASSGTITGTVAIYGLVAS